MYVQALSLCTFRRIEDFPPLGYQTEVKIIKQLLGRRVEINVDFHWSNIDLLAFVFFQCQSIHRKLNPLSKPNDENVEVRKTKSNE